MFRIPVLLLLVGGAVEAANVCTYEGGWSLRTKASTCPINAPVNCGNGIQLRCCPNGLMCQGEGDFGGSWCCKEGEDCRTPASASPKCPDPTWTLWGGNGTLKDGGWCCQPGDNGFYRGNMQAVGCTAAGIISLPSGNHFASTVPTVACVAPTSSSATSTTTDGTSPTPTSMGDADSESSNNGNASTSLSGGAIAGIVVGAMCGMALIAGLFALVWYRKRRARINASSTAAVTGGAHSSPGQAPPDMAQQPPHHQNGDSAYHGNGGLQQHSAYHDTAAKQQPSSPYGSPQDATSELGGVQRHEMGNGRADGAYHEME